MRAIVAPDARLGLYCGHAGAVGMLRGRLTKSGVVCGLLLAKLLTRLIDYDDDDQGREAEKPNEPLAFAP